MCMCHFGLHDRVKRAATSKKYYFGVPGVKPGPTETADPKESTPSESLRPRGSSPWEIPAHEKSPIVGLREYLVEMKGLEPSASGLQSPRSPS